MEHEETPPQAEETSTEDEETQPELDQLQDVETAGAAASGRRALLRRRLVRTGAPLLAAGLLGGGIAVGVDAGLGDEGGTTTVVQRIEPAPASTPRATVFTPSAGELTIQELYRRYAPGVVRILATSTVNDSGDPFFDPFGPQRQQALGSGFVIDKVGHIATNFHVVQGADEVRVNFTGDANFSAKVIGTDPSTDLAVLKVDAPASALTPIPLGNSDSVQVGDAVVAIGNPFGLDRTVTAGIVSAVQRDIEAPDRSGIDHVIQTDAAINHGNSGGPLLNMSGEVIGVNSQIATGNTGEQGNVGIGFAVPVNTVKEVASQLIEDGKVEHAWLGISMLPITPEVAETFRLPVDEGVLIASVEPDSPAEKAGLRPGDTSVVVNGETYVLGGDVITKADGKAITDSGQLRDLVRSKKPGEKLSLEINRDGSTQTLEVELGRRPTTVNNG